MLDGQSSLPFVVYVEEGNSVVKIVEVGWLVYLVISGKLCRKGVMRWIKGEL
jgi:hypothetical protein